MSLDQMKEQLKSHWRNFWLRYAGFGRRGRFAARMASLGTSPYHGKARFAEKYPHGFIAATAHVEQRLVRMGKGVYLGDGVVILPGEPHPEPVVFGDRVALYGDTFIQCGQGGKLVIGAGTHVQPGCHFRAYVSQIVIGEKVEIASSCSFYCFTHGVQPGVSIMEQDLKSKGPIRIGDGAWLGHGVTVLHGVTIGEGAVIGAGSVVTKDIPPNAIAAGVPAKVIKFRGGGEVSS